MAIKMQKWLSFFVLSSDNRKKSVTAWAKYVSAPERFYLTISEDGFLDFELH